MAKRPEPDPTCPNCAALSARLGELEVLVAKLGAELERRKSRKPKTSRTSSKPPSSDGPWTPRDAAKKPSGRKRGGQLGHKGSKRKLAPPEDVDETKIVKPEQCGSCGGQLTGDDLDPRRHQVADIPPPKPHITEHELHRLECPECGEVTNGSLPDEVHQSNFGPNVTALVVLLSGEYRMSRRNIRRFLADTHGVKISLGAISNIEGRMAEGLRGAHTEAMTSVAASATKHVDETSWRQSGVLAWVWAAVGEAATVFLIRDSRASIVARELIGDEPTGVVISDRYSGYSFIDLDQRQVCLAHLIRDFRRMAEGETELRWIGKRLLSLMGAVFRLWHLFKRDEIERAQLKRWSRSLRARILQLLNEGACRCGYETPGMCRGILKTEPAMWTFVEREGIEPTNNAAERAVRPVVIHRKTSLGSQSERGSRFVERMQTASATLRQNGRSLNDFVVSVAHAVLAGGPSPKLLG